jgi:hypothetical protein
MLPVEQLVVVERRQQQQLCHTGVPALCGGEGIKHVTL